VRHLHRAGERAGFWCKIMTDVYHSIFRTQRVKKGRCSARRKEDKDKEVKRIKFPFCNRKLLERLRFKCLEVCINMHFEVRIRAGPFLADCNRDFLPFEN
jgi:hypothetical protein